MMDHVSPAVRNESKTKFDTLRAYTADLLIYETFIRHNLILSQHTLLISCELKTKRQHAQ